MPEIGYASCQKGVSISGLSSREFRLFTSWEHAHDLPLSHRPSFIQIGNLLFHQHPLLQRIDALQKSVHKSLVHHGDLYARNIVMVGKRSSLDDSNSEGGKIIRRHRLEIRGWAHRRVRILGLAGNAELRFLVQEIERQVRHCGRVGDAWNSRYGGKDSSIIRVGVALGRVLHERHRVNIKTENVIGADAEIHVGEIPETVNRQPGSGKQRQGQGELGDH